MGAASQVKDALKFDVEIIKGPHAGLKMSFNKHSVTIGRGPENDIVLSGDPRVSRQHAEIKQRIGAEFVVVNLSQKNFVMVNGNMIQSEILVNDSVIVIGDSEIRFNVELPAQASVAPIAAAPVLTPAAPQPHSAPIPFPTTPPPSAPLAGIGSSAPMAASRPMPPPSPMPMSQPLSYGGYQAPTPGPAPAVSSGGLGNPKVRFYGIIAILVLVGWFLMSPSKNQNAKDPNAIRTSTMSMQDVADAEKRSQELLTIRKEKYDTTQYRRAQENFIKGFRDFQQGQYARAREAFQVVLNLDPENELAKRYYHLSKIKFDEVVKFNMIQGNRYREKRNWRMCQSNYSNVITMLGNRKDDPTFKEAKQFYDECTLNLQGRF